MSGNDETIDDKQPAYSQRVAENLAHMGTVVSDWKAVTVSGMVETPNVEGVLVRMPIFLFPHDYVSAPSMFKSTDGELCCELCGTKPIKRTFWLQNDSRRLLLQVGSECVTHFEQGKSGERLAKEALWEQNRDLARGVVALTKQLGDAYKRHYRQNGLRKIAIYDPAAKQTFEALDKIVKNFVNGKSEFYEPTTDRAISGWIKKYGDVLPQLMEEAAALIARADSELD